MTKTLQAASNDVFHGRTTLERAIADLTEDGRVLSMHWSAETDEWDVTWWTIDRERSYRAQNTSLRMALCGVMTKRFTDLTASLVAQGALHE